MLSNTKYLVEVPVIATCYDSEMARLSVSLVKVEDGVYDLPHAYLTDAKTSAEIAQEVIESQVLAGEGEITSLSPAVLTTTPSRIVEGDRVVAAAHYVQVSDNVRTFAENTVQFDCTSSEAKVTLATDTETLILYRDGRITGDAVLSLDYATMIVSMM